MARVAVPLKYNRRNLFVRKVSTAMTCLGIALVVAVFLLVMSLAEGIKKTFAAPVSAQGLVALTVGAYSDVMSMIPRAEYEVVRTLPGIERGPDGKPLLSPEIVVLLNLPRKDGKNTNLVVRGVEPAAFALRPALAIVEGRSFRPGTNEAIVARNVRKRFAGLEIGSAIRSGTEQWLIVGIFDAGNSPNDSEIWADFSNVQSQTGRENMLSVIRMRASDRSSRVRLVGAISSDQRIRLVTKSEAQYYAEQAGSAKPIEFLAYLVGVIMAIGASFGAMNTMYAQVAARTGDIATLRALGYPRIAVMVAFLIESIVLALIGGTLGAVTAFLVVRTFYGEPTGTQNVAAFSEVLFKLQLTNALVGRGLVFALVIGAAGGMIPALQASRMKITDALRAG